MASKSYYTVDERTRLSVIAAQGTSGTTSINEVHESMHARWSQEFDQSAFFATISNLQAVVEGICLNGANGWTEASRLQPDIPRLSSRLLEGSSVPPVLKGHDRATLSLYDPIQSLGEMCDNFHNQVNAWATKATYFSEVSSPLIVRTTKGSTSETETARMIREALEFVGPIDRAYVRRFSAFGRSMVDPLAKLKALERFIASVLMEKYEITLDDSKQETETTANPHGGVSNRVKGLSAIARHADSIHADGTNEKPSPAPKTDLKRNHASSIENPDSNSCESSNSKTPFAIDATTIPALALALPNLTIDEPSRDPASSSLLQERSTFYDIKPDAAPPGTPQWKIDLSERKGHRIHLLHVGDSELDILAKSLSHLYNVTSKADECFDFIIKKRNLAKKMKQMYEQWAYEYLERTRTETTKAEKSSSKGATRLDYNDGNDFDEPKHTLGTKPLLSGSRYVPHTLDLDTAIGYGPHDDASGYNQLQRAAQSSLPSPTAQRYSSIIDLESYDLDSERSTTPTPANHSSSPPASTSSLLSLDNISITSPGDFDMASDDEGSEGSDDSDKTVRGFSHTTYEGEGARRGLGSPVPFTINVDDDDDMDMDERDNYNASSENWESTLGDGADVAGGLSTTATTAIAGQNTDNTEQATANPQRLAKSKGSLLDRSGKRVGLFGEEL